MGFTKKTWKNRIAEYINRRLITMEDGNTNLVTVARDEGTISQEGDAFNAANMNDLEDRIAAGFEEINQSLTELIKVEYFSVANFKFPANVATTVTIPMKQEGYHLAGIIEVSPNKDHLVLSRFTVGDESANLRFTNTYASDIYANVGCSGLFIKKQAI